VRCKHAGTLWSLSRAAFQTLTTSATKSTTGLALAALRRSPLLGGLTDDQLELIASELETLELEGGEVIGFEGKMAEAFYIVQKGSVVLTREVYVEGQDFDEEVGRLSAGSVFGEHALDYIPKSERRGEASTAETLNGSEPNESFAKPKMLRLANGSLIEAPGSSSKSFTKTGKPRGSSHARRSEAPPVWRDTVMTDPEVPQTVLLWMSREHFVDVLGHLSLVLVKNETRKLVEGCSIFEDLRPNQRQKLADAIKLRGSNISSHPQGSVIYRQDHIGSGCMYIVRRGTIGLTTVVHRAPPPADEAAPTPSFGSAAAAPEAPSLQTTTRHLTQGGAFGDSALLEDVPMGETAFAVEDVELIVLTRRLVIKVLGSLAVIKEGLATRKLWEERRARAAEFVLEDLDIVTKLGAGTFGRVRLVRHRKTGKAFALKSMCKGKLIELRQLDNTINEKKVMAQINHPFLNQLVAVMCDDEPQGEVHLLLEVCLGGELFTLLQQAVCFDLNMATFCSSCVALALVHLHARRIVYRDLKPENLVFNSHGYVVIIDFGFAKVLDESAKTYTLCGTPQYLAPEIVKSQGHGFSADWWAFGILLYEMLTGSPPFEDASAMGIYKQIMTNQITYPLAIRGKAKEIISKLLVSAPSKRLGGGKGGAPEVLDDAFFSAYDWDKLERHAYEPPWVPVLSDGDDTSHFEINNAEDPDLGDGDVHYRAAELPSYEVDVLRLDCEFSTLEGKVQGKTEMKPEDEREMLRAKIVAVKERAKQRRLADEAAKKAEEAARRAAEGEGDEDDGDAGEDGGNRPVSAAMLANLATALELAKAAEEVAVARATSALAYAEQTAHVASAENEKWALAESTNARRASDEANEQMAKAKAATARAQQALEAVAPVRAKEHESNEASSPAFGRRRSVRMDPAAPTPPALLGAQSTRALVQQRSPGSNAHLQPAAGTQPCAGSITLPNSGGRPPAISISTSPLCTTSDCGFITSPGPSPRPPRHRARPASCLAPPTVSSPAASVLAPTGSVCAASPTSKSPRSSIDSSVPSSQYEGAAVHDSHDAEAIAHTFLRSDGSLADGPSPPAPEIEIDPIKLSDESSDSAQGNDVNMSQHNTPFGGQPPMGIVSEGSAPGAWESQPALQPLAPPIAVTNPSPLPQRRCHRPPSAARAPDAPVAAWEPPSAARAPDAQAAAWEAQPALQPLAPPPAQDRPSPLPRRRGGGAKPSPE